MSARYADQRAHDIAWMTARERNQLDQRRELCQTRTATLDGWPAVISGALNDFATVATLGGSGHACEFAWPTVARIVANGGAFKS